jgi:hypothetical protein
MNLFACSPNEGSGVRPAEETMEKIFGKMEDSGKYPVLDRTDTLAGVDADKNGIRDDIDLYISKQEFTPEQEIAIKQEAAVMQRSVTINVKDKKALAKLQVDSGISMACLSYTKFGMNGNIRGSSLALDIESLTANTKKRLKNYLAYNHTLDGSVWSSTNYKGNPCVN